MRYRTFVAAVAASLVSVSTTHAASGVLITASGVWAANAPATSISAPGESWSLSFLEPNPLYADPGTIFGMGWATGFSQDLSYTLGGVSTGSVFSQAEFYDAGNGGGIDVSFNSSLDVLSIFSSTSTAYADEETGALIATPFAEAITESYNDASDAEGFGSIMIEAQDFTPTNPNNPAPSAAPEPEAWILMLVGVGLTGLAMRRRPSAPPRDGWMWPFGQVTGLVKPGSGQA